MRIIEELVEIWPNKVCNMFIIHNKLSQVRTMGIVILDTSFKTILLNSLPKSWNPAVASLYNNMLLSEAIQQLNV